MVLRLGFNFRKSNQTTIVHLKRINYCQKSSYVILKTFFLSFADQINLIVELNMYYSIMVLQH